MPRPSTASVLLAAFVILPLAGAGSLLARDAASASAAEAGDDAVVQLAVVGEEILRIDLATGEVSALRGDANNPGDTNRWTTIASPPTEPHSGRLRYRLLEGPSIRAAFLVDRERGTTWILKYQAERTAAWSLVRAR